EVADGLLRIAGVALGDLAYAARGQVIAQAIAAQEHGDVFGKFALGDFDEVFVVGGVRGASDVAEYFVAARVRHGFFFAEVSGVFDFADGRMVAGDFADCSTGDEVEARIAYVPDGHMGVFDEGQGQDAGHAGEFGIL